MESLYTLTNVADRPAEVRDLNGANSAISEASTFDRTLRTIEPLNTRCIICGEENPVGLKLQFQISQRVASAQWIPQGGWESFQGVIHGGVISAVLDESMSKAIISEGYQALTADLRIRFRKKVSLNEALFVRGWVVNVRNRRILAEASLATVEGAEKAHGWETFVMVRDVSPQNAQLEEDAST